MYYQMKTLHSIKLVVIGFLLLIFSSAVKTDSTITTSSYSDAEKACFGIDLELENISTEQANRYGDLCMSLLPILNLVSPHPYGISSEYVMLQYADSWYVFAANHGSDSAQAKLTNVRMAMNVMESSFMQKETLLASEIEFNRLDQDHDGIISVREAKTDDRLNAEFDRSDIDVDGGLSIAEYLIFKREATAAGE